MDADYLAQIASEDAAMASLWLIVAVALAASGLWLTVLRTLPIPILGRLTAPDSRPIRVRWPRRWAMWLAVVALALRIPGMFESPWYDETFTAGIARMEMLRAADVIAADVHPPGAYLMFWLVGRVSTAEWALRLPSLALGLWSLWLLYRVAIAIGAPEDAARLAACLAAVMPAHITYSTEARAYTLLLCGVLLLALGALRRRPGLYLVASVIVGYTHAVGLVYVAVAGAMCVLTIRRWRGVVIRSALLCAPAAALAWRQSSDVVDGWWNVFTLPGALWWPLRMTITDRILPSLLLPSLLPWMAVVVRALLQRQSSPRRWAMWLALALGVPAATAAASALWAPIHLDRALLPSATLLLIPVAALALRRNPVWRAGIAAPVLLALISSYTPEMQPTDLRQLFGACEGRQIYVLETAMGVMASYYRSETVYTTTTRINDAYQTLPDMARRAFRMVPEAIDAFRGRELCLVVQLTPLTSTREIKQLETLLLSRETSVLAASGWYTAYRVRP